MTKKELIVKVLEDLGFKPHEDEDGDLAFRYEMKNIFAVVGNESEQYLVLTMPQFSEIEDGEEHIAHIAEKFDLLRNFQKAQTFKQLDQQVSHGSRSPPPP